MFIGEYVFLSFGFCIASVKIPNNGNIPFHYFKYAKKELFNTSEHLRRIVTKVFEEREELIIRNRGTIVFTLHNADNLQKSN